MFPQHHRPLREGHRTQLRAQAIRLILGQGFIKKNNLSVFVCVSLQCVSLRRPLLFTSGSGKNKGRGRLIAGLSFELVT